MDLCGYRYLSGGDIEGENVPVEFSGEDTTLADRGLMLLSGYDTTVDLVIKSPERAA